MINTHISFDFTYKIIVYQYNKTSSYILQFTYTLQKQNKIEFEYYTCMYKSNNICSSINNIIITISKHLYKNKHNNSNPILFNIPYPLYAKHIIEKHDTTIIHLI